MVQLFTDMRQFTEQIHVCMFPITGDFTCKMLQ